MLFWCPTCKASAGVGTVVVVTGYRYALILSKAPFCARASKDRPLLLLGVMPLTTLRVCKLLSIRGLLEFLSLPKMGRPDIILAHCRTLW